MQFKILTLLLISLLRWISILVATIEGPAFCAQDLKEEDPSRNSTPVPALVLRTGQSYPLDGIMTHKFTVQPDGIVNAIETSEGITLKGIHPGAATFRAEVDGKKIEIPIIVKFVAKLPMLESGIPSELKQFDKSIRIKHRLGQWVLEGEILGRKDYQRALRLMRDYPQKIIIRATTAPGVKASLMEQALSALKSQGLDQVDIASAGHKYFLYGAVSHPSEVEEAFEMTQSILPTIENRLPLPIQVEPTFTVRVHLLELSKKAHKRLGLTWGNASHPFGRFAPGNFALNPAWDVTLHHLANEGLAKVLAEPFLSVKLGSSAELSAGGEFPIRTSEKFENRVHWKHYGIKLRIHIVGVAGRRVRSRIETESSQLDSALTVGGIPALRTNRLRTEIDATEGEAILLTGLFQSSSAKDIEKVPFLGNIPLIGELFKSRDFRNEESELLIALLPTREAVRTKLPLKSEQGLQIDTNWHFND